MSFEPAGLDGVHVAVVTPFLPDGGVDHDALAGLVDGLVARGVQGIVPCGSTGEAATLTHDEHIAVIRTTVEAVAGRVPVIAGTGSNSTDEAVVLTQGAAEVGADAALLITPYYNKPSQDGLYHHFRTIAQAGGLPVVLYNIPGRSAVSLHPETVARLADVPGIIGIKDASGSLDWTWDVIRRTPSSFRITAGDDSALLPLLAQGGCGVISVAAHLVPDAMLALMAAWHRGDVAEARRLQISILDLERALFAETNPAPIKAALWMAGMIPCADLRLPLTQPSETTRAALRSAMAALGLPTDGPR
jgi:4-hydroxy-tetrahydrodipicolinate synthase